MAIQAGVTSRAICQECCCCDVGLRGALFTLFQSINCRFHSRCFLCDHRVMYAAGHLVCAPPPHNRHYPTVHALIPRPLSLSFTAFAKAAQPRHTDNTYPPPNHALFSSTRCLSTRPAIKQPCRKNTRGTTQTGPPSPTRRSKWWGE